MQRSAGVLFFTPYFSNRITIACRCFDGRIRNPAYRADKELAQTQPDRAEDHRC